MDALNQILQKIGMNRSYFNSLVRNSDKCYTSYYIEKNGKKGKKRDISAPNYEIKALQRWLLRTYLEKVPISDRATGFIRGRGIKTNAKYHVERRFILCIDLENFFPSITYDRVYEIFIKCCKDKLLAEKFAKICTYKKRLPQGGATSPAISNIVFYPIDEKVKTICNAKRINYSRYADDLTFSSNHLPDLESLYPVIEKILAKARFRVNKRKIRYMSGRGCKRVTGIILNSGKLTVGKKRKREIRAALFNYLVKKDKRVNPMQLLGNLAFIRDIEPDFLGKFIKYKEKLQKKFPLND